MVLNIYPDTKRKCFGGIIDEKMVVDFDRNNGDAVTDQDGGFGSPQGCGFAASRR